MYIYIYTHTHYECRYEAMYVSTLHVHPPKHMSKSYKSCTFTCIYKYSTKNTFRMYICVDTYKQIDTCRHKNLHHAYTHIVVNGMKHLTSLCGLASPLRHDSARFRLMCEPVCVCVHTCIHMRIIHTLVKYDPILHSMCKWHT
jgi:hypothetical protein